MAAVAHGWKPDQFKGPSVKVAKEFNKADERKAHADKWAKGHGKAPSAKRARNNAKSNVGEYKT